MWTHETHFISIKHIRIYFNVFLRIKALNIQYVNMLYDIICISLIILAFVGGYQNSILQTCTLFFSVLLSFAATLYISPYLLEFYRASIGAPPNIVIVPLVVGLGLALWWLMHRILRLLMKEQKMPVSSVLPQVVGGLIMAGIMLLSISVLTTFTDQARILSDDIKMEAHLYGWMEPINEKTATAWVQLSSSAQKLQGR